MLVDLLGLAVAVDEDGDHVDDVIAGIAVRLRATSGSSSLSLSLTAQSPTLTDSAACAAARRATGTRYGEALT